MIKIFRNRFIWLVKLYCPKFIKTQPKTLFTLAFRSLTEIFIGRSCYSVLLRLHTMID